MNEAEASSQRSRGMRDLLPEEMSRVRAVEDAFVRTCESWGYQEIRTPAIEPLHLFTSAGTLSPQTLDRVYSFLDWDGWTGERVVLRPDSTIPAARLYAEHLDVGRVAKLFYAQNVFRFTDDGSDREEAQCGVELIGASGPQCEIELIQLSLAVLARLGLRGELHLSHTGIARSVMAAAGLTPEEQARAYDRLLDGDSAVIEEVEARLPSLNSPLRMLFEAASQPSSFIANVRASLGDAIPGLVAALNEMDAVAGTLGRFGVEPLIDAVLARNFEYYTGIVFKIFVNGERLITGGRYDGLLELVSGTAAPASGFGLYVRNTAALASGAAGPDAGRVLVVAQDDSPDVLVDAYALAQRLRAQGWRVDTIDDGSGDHAPRVTVRAGANPFAVALNGSANSFDEVEAVARALGAPR